jgi:hypothetical protein
LYGGNVAFSQKIVKVIEKKLSINFYQTLCHMGPAVKHSRGRSVGFGFKSPLKRKTGSAPILNEVNGSGAKKANLLAAGKKGRNYCLISPFGQK